MSNGTLITLTASPSSVTKELPKCLDVVNGKTILEHQIREFYDVVTNCKIVTGYEGFKVVSERGDLEFSFRDIGVSFSDNYKWKTSTEVLSTKIGLSELSSGSSLPIYITYGDLIYGKNVVDKISGNDAKGFDIVLVVEDKVDYSRYNEFVLFDKDTRKVKRSGSFNDKEGLMSFIGLSRINTLAGALALQDACQIISEDSSKHFINVIDYICGRVSIGVVVVSHDDWVDIDCKKDLTRFKGELK